MPDFDVSRKFYSALGFEEKELGSDMSLFTFGALSFYLQKHMSKIGVDNTMVFVEVDDVEKYWENWIHYTYYINLHQWDWLPFDMKRGEKSVLYTILLGSYGILREFNW